MTTLAVQDNRLVCVGNKLRRCDCDPGGICDCEPDMIAQPGSVSGNVTGLCDGVNGTKPWTLTTLESCCGIRFGYDAQCVLTASSTVTGDVGDGGTTSVSGSVETFASGTVDHNDPGGIVGPFRRAPWARFYGGDFCSPSDFTSCQFFDLFDVAGLNPWIGCVLSFDEIQGELPTQPNAAPSALLPWLGSEGTVGSAFATFNNDNVSWHYDDANLDTRHRLGVMWRRNLLGQKPAGIYACPPGNTFTSLAVEVNHSPGDGSLTTTATVQGVADHFPQVPGIWVEEFTYQVSASVTITPLEFCDGQPAEFTPTQPPDRSEKHSVAQARARADAISGRSQPVQMDPGAERVLHQQIGGCRGCGE